jgi:hypothetical protein
MVQHSNLHLKKQFYEYGDRFPFRCKAYFVNLWEKVPRIPVSAVMRHVLNNMTNRIATLQRKQEFMNEAQKLWWQPPHSCVHQQCFIFAVQFRATNCKQCDVQDCMWFTTFVALSGTFVRLVCGLKRTLLVENALAVVDGAEVLITRYHSCCPS